MISHQHDFTDINLVDRSARHLAIDATFTCGEKHGWIRCADPDCHTFKCIDCWALMGFAKEAE